MLYNLGHVEAALLLEREEGRRLYLRGPVDVLVLEQEREGWEMALRPFYEMCLEIRGLGEDSFSGKISTWEEGSLLPRIPIWIPGTEKSGWGY